MTKHISSILLGVNIDHVATIRQARGTHYPDPIQAAFEAEQAGADLITLHLREDRRHIQDRDLALLKQTITTRINLECAVTDEMLKIATHIQPADCCLVPEKRTEITTEGGLNIFENISFYKDACAKLADAGIRVSLFIDPDLKQIEAALKTGTPVIEIHTGGYADATNLTQKKIELERVIVAAEFADKAGLHVNAGHGLNYHNVAAIAQIPQLKELNIGHAIVARSIFSGFQTAVKEMKQIMHMARLSV